MFRFLASILTVVFLILILTGIFGIGLIRPLFRKKGNGKRNSNQPDHAKLQNKSRKIISDDVGEYVNFEEVEKSEKKEEFPDSEIKE
jgi:hypothetical protein